MTRADIERDPVSYIQHLDATLTLTSDQLNGKLDAIARTGDNHTVTLAEHSRTLAEHGRTLAEHSRTLAEHSRTLAEHGAKLNALARTQDGHTTMLREILRRLPETAEPAERDNPQR